MTYNMVMKEALFDRAISKWFGHVSVASNNLDHYGQPSLFCHQWWTLYPERSLLILAGLRKGIGTKVAQDFSPGKMWRAHWALGLLYGLFWGPLLLDVLPKNWNKKLILPLTNNLWGPPLCSEPLWSLANQSILVYEKASDSKACLAPGTMVKATNQVMCW